MERIAVEKVCKRFGPQMVFEGISFEASRAGSVCLWGPNGSGKSTLLKIMAGLVRATAGKVVFFADGRSGPPAHFRNMLGVSAPDVVMYEELTPNENLEFLSRARGLKRDVKYERELLEMFSLAGVADKPLGAFSSGMKQKFNLIGALAHRPPALFLDEPTSFMDEAGRRQAEKIVAGLKPGALLVVATNDKEEKTWCEATVELRG